MCFSSVFLLVSGFGFFGFEQEQTVHVSRRGERIKIETLCKEKQGEHLYYSLKRKIVDGKVSKSVTVSSLSFTKEDEEMA